jgi:hypothetical protein
LIRDLVRMRDRRATGVLEVSHGDVRTFLYIEEGVPVFAEHGTLGDTLGRLLLRRGTISQEHYAAIIRAMTSQLVANEQMRFGEVAVELGFLTFEQMTEALALQVQQKVLTCLAWDAPQRAFREGDDALDGITRFPCAIDRIVLTAMAMFYDEARVGTILEPHLDRYVLLRADASEVEERLDLGGRERHTLRRLRGRTRLDDLLGSAGDREALAQLVAALVLLGEVELLDTPAVSEVRRRIDEPSEVLAEAIRKVATPDVEATEHVAPAKPVERPARPEAVVVPAPPARARIEPRPAPVRPAGGAPFAIARLARDLRALADRPRPADRPDAPLRHVEQLAQGLARAAPPRKPPSTERERRLAAELASRAGRAQMAAGMWREALDEFRRALELDPEAQEYALYALWAELQVAPEGHAGSKKVELVKEAAAQIRRDPSFGFAFYVIGALRMEEGESAKAEKALMKAIELDPHNRDAERRLRLLHMRTKNKKKR